MVGKSTQFWYVMPGHDKGVLFYHPPSPLQKNVMTISTVQPARSLLYLRMRT